MKNPWLIIRFQKPPVSFWLDGRLPKVLLILTLSLLLVIIISLVQGEYYIAPLEVVKTLLRLDTNSDAQFIINTLRLPRTLVALLVGVGLAIAGCIMQTITRNPLADPSIIGINAGAGLTAVLFIVIFPNLPIALLPISAFVGGLLVAGAIYLVAWQGENSVIRLVLVGIGFNFMVFAITNIIVTFGNINSVSQALVWLTGSVYGKTNAQVLILLPWIMIFMIIAWIMSKELNSLNLGENLSIGLGLPLGKVQLMLLITSVALSSASVAIAGTIGFVGLVAPHMARFLVGNTHQGLIPVTGLMGGLLVVGADVMGRWLFSPTELPCGIVTAIIGAPYFLFLLTKSR
ncbi:iron ABC transporter permease [Cyanobacterium stanieri LEGE 03274]|uniref:Iron ABC transporter permease n=1 Tax=Cyanobacterium stanieri LEGE 03274 TaxID=1828756 RepID=A0ABR9V005_9CHRO|nr:iron ABC transporter permease [Cyanobacterium stanieri]MBE9221208.1 iron ABC transporter permease [Cyanobacterium stanieri LEGE 03274]